MHQTALRPQWALRTMLVLTDLRLVSFAEIPYLLTLGFRPSQVGWLISLVFTTQMLSNVPAGWWSDRFHRRRHLAITAGLICLTVSMAGFGSMINAAFWTAASLAVLRGIGFALYYSTNDAFALLHFGSWNDSAAVAQAERARSWGYTMAIQCAGAIVVLVILTQAPHLTMRWLYFAQSAALSVALLASLRLPPPAALPRRRRHGAWQTLRALGSGWWYICYSTTTLVFTNSMVSLTQLQLSLRGLTAHDLIRVSVGFYSMAALAAFFIVPVEHLLGRAGAVMAVAILCLFTVGWYGLASEKLLQYGGLVFGFLFGLRQGIDKTRVMQLSQWPALLFSIQTAVAMGLTSLLIAFGGNLAESIGIRWVFGLVTVVIVAPTAICGWRARYTSRGW